MENKGEFVEREEKELEKKLRSAFGEEVSLAEMIYSLKFAAESLEHFKGFEVQATKLRAIYTQASRPLLVMVMGEFKTGKSTFINALLQEELLKSDATPATAVVSMLSYGREKKIIGHFLNGEVLEFSIDQLKEITAEGDESKKILRDALEYVEIFVPNDILRNITIIDTPGINVDKKEHVKSTKNFMDRADMVVWVFGTEIKKTEIQVMDALRQEIKPVAVMNRIDEIDEEDDDIDEIVAENQKKLHGKVEKLFPVSAGQARMALIDGDYSEYNESRWKEFLRNFQTDVVKKSALIKAEITINKILVFLHECVELLEKLKSDDRQKIENTLFDMTKRILGVSFFQSDMDILQPEEAFLFKQMKFFYAHGVGTQKDPEKALLYLEYLAKHFCDREAQCELAEKYAVGKEVAQDFELAASLYEKAAQKGSAKAQSSLGAFYEYGLGSIKKNMKIAIQWYRKAAEQGEAEAQIRLAEAYFAGNGLTKDDTQGFSWYEKAAQNNVMYAQYLLGTFYCEGKGVDRDYVKARYWYKKAAEQGSAEAQDDLSVLYYRGKGGNQDSSVAWQWCEKSARQDYVKAQFHLGFLLEEGHGVPLNEEKARFWYEKAAQKGEPLAQCRLADFYDRGRGGKQNYQMAKYWYGQAAKQGNKKAEKALENLKEYTQADFPPGVSYWFCDCGYRNTENFCTECGKKKIVTWCCTCGQKNEGNFCASCGRPRKVDTAGWVCSCGVWNSENFCMECGAKRP